MQSTPRAQDAPRIVADFTRPVHCLFGVPFDAVGLDEVVEAVHTAIADRRRLHVATPNVDFLRLARSDAAFREALCAADLCPLDGMPLVWLARALGISGARRVAGADLFEALAADRARPLTAHFFGADKTAGARAAAALDGSDAGVRCAGATAPGYGSLESMSAEPLLRAANATQADLLAVSIGARRGLLWLARNEARLASPVVANLGAVVHFAAGSLRRAPQFMRALGLEWLWRTAAEPKLALRYGLDFLCLARVAVSGLAPALALRALRPGDSRVGLQVARNGRTSRLALSGVWREDRLGPLRDALGAAAARGDALGLSLDGVADLDTATLGLLLIAFGHQRRSGLAFALTANGRRIRAILRAHGCAFLLTSAAQRPSGARRADAELARPAAWALRGTGR